MNKFLANYARYVPIVVPILIIVVQALIDSNNLHIGIQTLTLLDAVLGSLGLHALHVRTK